MTTNAFVFVGMYDHVLRAAAHILEKGRAHAEASGVSEREMLGWRLIDDMQPLSFQLEVICRFSRQWLARVAGLPVPDSDPGDVDLDVAGFQRLIADARGYLARLQPGEFEGRGAADITQTIIPGLTLTRPGEEWLAIFATTNIFFHLSTAYDILRSRGVQIGKADLFPGWLGER
jgi:uncharacterized protein